MVSLFFPRSPIRTHWEYDDAPVKSLWLSRYSESDELGAGKMSNKARLEDLCRCGIETDMAENILPNGKIPTVDEMLAESALISAGVDKPSIKKKRQRKRKPLKWIEKKKVTRRKATKRVAKKKATRKKASRRR